MSIKTVLQHDYKLPPFSTYRKQLLLSLLFLLLPNIPFLAIAAYQGLARPLINIDYFLPAILLVLPLPYKLGKIAGILLFMLAIIIDFLMFTMQLFPFMDMAAVKYLATFLFTAPVRIIALVLIASVYTLIFPFLLNKIKNISWKLTVFWSCLGCVFFWSMNHLGMEMKYHDEPGLRFGRNNYYVMNSQFKLYHDEMSNIWIQLITSVVPKISPYTNENASHRFKQPYSDKILLIVAESWGVAREKNVQRSILQGIYNQQNNLEFIEEGFFDFTGATVQAEMRELCLLETQDGYAFSKLPAKTFDSCLPNVLKNKGYATFALHGSNGVLYERDKWYPIAGFQKSMFNENFPNLPHCEAFNGVCDSALMNVISNRFKETGNKKSFVYWMTLTSHFSYSRKDLHDARFNCQELGVREGDICNNFSLQAQFFDELGELIKRQEMKGVEVIVVGDHMPPIVDMGKKFDIPLHKNIRWNDVSWVHFKVK